MEKGDLDLIYCFCSLESRFTFNSLVRPLSNPIPLLFVPPFPFYELIAAPKRALPCKIVNFSKCCSN